MLEMLQPKRTRKPRPQDPYFTRVQLCDRPIMEKPI